MNNVPMPDFSMLYEKNNITADIEPHLLELTYTDKAISSKRQSATKAHSSPTSARLKLTRWNTTTIRLISKSKR